MAVAATATSTMMCHDVMPPQDKFAVSPMLPAWHRKAALQNCNRQCFQHAKHSIAKFCALKVDRVSRSVPVMQISTLDVGDTSAWTYPCRTCWTAVVRAEINTRQKAPSFWQTEDGIRCVEETTEDSGQPRSSTHSRRTGLGSRRQCLISNKTDRRSPN